MSDVSIAAIPKEETKMETAAELHPADKTAAKDKPTPIPANQRGVSTVAMDQLERNPDQPRKYFDKEKLEELTRSISDKGVLQPILVRPLPRQSNHEKKHYQIVAGERRWQAALKAKLDAMPVLIRELTDQDVLEIGVVENVQRADLNPIEEALAYKALSEQFKRTQDDIAQAVGKSRPHVTNMCQSALRHISQKGKSPRVMLERLLPRLTQQSSPTLLQRRDFPFAKLKTGSAVSKRQMERLLKYLLKRMLIRERSKMTSLIFWAS
jgi:ParB/RepB/Spo0J family partition protein